MPQKTNPYKSMTPAKGPLTKDDYNLMPFKNPAIERFMRKQKRKSVVKDVELYDSKTKKSKMIYKPGKN